VLIGLLLQLDADEEPASPDPVNLATSSSNAWDRADADEYIAPLALQQGGMDGVVPGRSRQRSPCRGSNFTIAHPPLGHRSRTAREQVI